MSEYYTYLWLREDGTPYYVGKGKNNRAYSSHSHGVHCPPEKERIVIYPASSEADAFETETDLIWYYGRKDLGLGSLRNLTDGGENPPNAKGIKRSEYHRACVRKRMVGWAPSEHQRKAVGEATRKRFANGWRFPTLTEEQREKIAASRRGKPATESAKENLRVAVQKRPSRSKVSKCRGVS